MAGASGGCCSVIISLFEMMIEIGVLTEICESWASGSWAADSFRTLPASISYHDWVLRSETSPRQRDVCPILCASQAKGSTLCEIQNAPGKSVLLNL